MISNDTNTLDIMHNETKTKLLPLLRSLWGTFRHLISLLTHFASMGGVGWRSGAATGCQWGNLIGMSDTQSILIVIWFVVVIMTAARLNPPSLRGWLIWHWGNHDCPSGSVGQTRWNLSGWSISNHIEAQRGMARVRDLLMRLYTVLYIAFVTTFSHFHLYIYLNKRFLIYLDVKWSWVIQSGSVR